MKRRTKTVFISALGLCAAVSVALGASEPAPTAGYFQQDVHYTIRANLDTDAKMLTGDETIRYTNNSPDTLADLYLHLYPNALRSKESAFIRDYARRFNFTLSDIPEENRSFLEIANVTVDAGPVGVEVDDTIARLRLPRPLPPGSTMEIRLEFREKVPKILGRGGYQGAHYDMSQWYPKVVVYDENGFHPDKFIAWGEFYGEFGTFDVAIDVPSQYVVAATGAVVSGDAGWDYNRSGDSRRGGGGPSEPAGRKTVHFHAENVHDFAWCADPDFVVQDSTWNDTKVRVFYRKQHEQDWRDTTLVHALRAIEWLSKKIGPYPYPQVSVVDALNDWGMEYPMLVMNGYVSESLVLHEVGHIYFYGALANDERNEAWLDEGFATFLSAWYLTERYGPYGDRSSWNWYQRMTPQYTLGDQARREVGDLLRNRYGERVAGSAEEFVNSYYDHVYTKAALFLNALRSEVGADTFDAILREYYDRWKFKHVNEARFRKVCEDLSGRDLSLLFEQWLYTRKTCDYRLDKMNATKRADGGYDANVVVRREGELFCPIDVAFDLDNGERETFRIDGKLRTIERTFDLPAKPKRAAVNPENEIFDVAFADNFLPRRRDFQIDWPGNDYYPEWGYQIRHRPGAWYNNVDGLKAGYVIQGSYLGAPPRFRLGVYYGFLSDRVDFSASYEHRLRLFGNNSVFQLSGYKMEGRRDFDASLVVRRRVTLLSPPTHKLILGFDFHELTDPRYLTSPEIYDTNRIDIGPYLAYGVYPEADILLAAFDFGLKFGREWWGGDHKYERFTTSARFYTRGQLVPVDARLRLFLGLAGGNAPVQRKFGLAGAGPLENEKLFWLRSPGAVWDDLNYHQSGDGNLRGYAAGSFGVNRLVALNLEAGSHLPLFALETLVRPLVGSISWYGFFDAGTAMDAGNPIKSSGRVGALVDQGFLDWALMDAGVGFRSRRVFPFWDLTLRLDIPVWVNHPEINFGETEKTRFRYLFSIDGSF